MMYNMGIDVDDGCWVGRGIRVNESESGLGMPVSMIDTGGESKFEFRRRMITTKGLVMIILYYNRDIGADAGCWRSKRVMISINLGLGMPVSITDVGS